MLVIYRNSVAAHNPALDRGLVPSRNATNSSIIHPLITSTKTSSSENIMVSGSRLWFGFVLSSALLLFEKLVIQAIAYNFHKVSYEDRIATSKFHIKVLTTLYENSRDLHRKDTYIVAEHDARRKSTGLHVARARLKKTGQKVKRAAQTSSSILGAVASEIAGQGTLQPGNPRSVVISSLNSKKQSIALSRRIWYSFITPGRNELTVEDISHVFPDATTAEAAFEVLDKDANGDLTRDELGAACVEIHRERMALQLSMRDVDSAVGRLDSIFMSVFVLITAMIVATMLSTTFSTLVSSFGTLVLGLSWLIGTTAQEILGSIIYLFTKHPYDVGDRVDVDDNHYIVKEIRLLTTGKNVIISHNQLAQKPLVNLRRSGPIEETFKFVVAFATSFEQIEKLRSKMIHWIEGEKRDFLPGLDITVVDFEKQSSLLLSVGIRFKSNWQQDDLKAQRRNRWLCQFKVFLAECQIYGPSGDPNAVTNQRVTMVPYPPTEDPSLSATDPATAVEAILGDGNRSYRFMDKGAAYGDQDPFEDIRNTTAPGTTPSSRPMSPANALEQGRARSGLPSAYNVGAPPYQARRHSPSASYPGTESYELTDQSPRFHS